jgi:ABC-type phosphate transport system substrate-binding protein
MRILSRLITGVAVTATALALAAPAMADPPAGVTPRPGDVVGVGSDTIQNVMDQFSVDYNRTHRTGPRLYSWDATNPHTGLDETTLIFKTGCAMQTRPNGSSAGVTAVKTNAGGTTAGRFCEDFARSSRARKSTDPAFARGGLAFVTLAGDAVTYATQAVTNAPANLTTAQLTGIYECTITNWSQVGGKNAPIHAFLPQVSSGTRAFFLTAINVTSPGPCVSDGTGQTGSIEENEGVNPLLHDVNAIFPYSIGKFIAEKFHSAPCIRGGDCQFVKRGPHKGVACVPRGAQNLFGCDSHGTMVLHKINGSMPTIGTGAATKINPAFTPAFTRQLFEVVRFIVRTRDHIPAYLEPFFGSKGWVCTNATARADLLNYGFVILPVCGHTQ